MSVVTSRDNILLIAPELAELLTSIAQVLKVTVATALNSTAYIVQINSSTATYTSDTAATTAEITAGLVSAINTLSAGVTAIDNGDGTLNITANTAGTAFTCTTGNYLSQTTVQANYDYIQVYNLVVNYVALTVGFKFKSFMLMAQTYLAAHLFSLISSTNTGAGAGGNGNIQSQSVGSVSVTYAQILPKFSTQYDATKYGREFGNIRRMTQPRFLQVNP